MVGRHDERNVGIVVQRTDGEHNCREGVFRLGFDDEVFFRNGDANFFALGNAVEFVVLVGNDSVVCFRSRKHYRSFQRVLKEGVSSELRKLNELFRIELSGKRPKARTRASGEDYGKYSVVHCLWHVIYYVILLKRGVIPTPLILLSPVATTYSPETRFARDM